jgi:formylglycine-generating enzyme required for sulfatase activity
MTGKISFSIFTACAVACLVEGCAPIKFSRRETSSGALPSFTNKLGMKFLRIPAGEFVMGSPPTEPDRLTNETPHHVQITRAFWLGETTITFGQFSKFVEATGYRTAAEQAGVSHGAWNVAAGRWDTRPDGSWKNPGFAQNEKHPVVCVTWHDANAFCEWLGARENRRCRLPTEAEWEYACRAGTTTAFPWGDNPDDGAGRANGDDATAKNIFTIFPAFNWSDGFIYTSPVGTFRPNSWGLYDMIGNTLQWCGDRFGTYPPGAVTDPMGAANGGERVLRGGAFVYGPARCRCAFRGRNSPGFENFYIGFRVVLEDLDNSGKPVAP